MKDKKFYDTQKELIDLAMVILKEWFEDYKYDERYKHLFYVKWVPPHISQPLQALRSKIAFKPIYEKIEGELDITHHNAKNLIKNYWISYTLQNLDNIKPLLSKHHIKTVMNSLDKLI